MLSKDSHSLKCSACSISVPVINGIPVFAKDAPYWCEIPKEEMKQLLERISAADVNNWKEILKDTLDRKDKSLFNYIFDENRSGWKYLIDLPKESRILDIGSGWGTLAFPLAKHFKEVVSVEPVFERAKFQMIRKKKEGVNNLNVACMSSTELCFPDGYFDLVILNGVLEWMPLSYPAMDPRKAQIKALKSIGKILRKEGQLYVGIENRCSFHYFLGYKEEHSGLRFGSLLPRGIANIYSRIVKRKNYNTYTYSYKGYKNLLKESGFTDTQIYLPLPNYRNYSFIIPSDNINALKFFVFNLINNRVHLMSKLGQNSYKLAKFILSSGIFNRLIKWFVPAYSITTRKPG